MNIIKKSHRAPIGASLLDGARLPLKQCKTALAGVLGATEGRL